MVFFCSDKKTRLVNFIIINFIQTAIFVCILSFIIFQNENSAYILHGVYVVIVFMKQGIRVYYHHHHRRRRRRIYGTRKNSRVLSVSHQKVLSTLMLFECSQFFPQTSRRVFHNKKKEIQQPQNAIPHWCDNFRTDKGLFSSLIWAKKCWKQTHRSHTNLGFLFGQTKKEDVVSYLDEIERNVVQIGRLTLNLPSLFLVSQHNTFWINKISINV